MYSNMLSSWSIAVTEATECLLVRPVIVGAAWMQGEADAEQTNSAAVYQTNLTAHISNVRADIAATNCYFVCEQLSTNLSLAQMPFRDMVRSAVTGAVSVVGNAVALDCSPFPLQPSSADFTTAGITNLGVNIGALMSTNLHL
jgi:hypothetical protein